MAPLRYPAPRKAEVACGVCRHPERAAIDQALAAGVPLRVIAKGTGVSKSALHRHSYAHGVGRPISLRTARRIVKTSARRGWRQLVPWLVVAGVSFLAGLGFVGSRRGSIA